VTIRANARIFEHDISDGKVSTEIIIIVNWTQLLNILVVKMKNNYAI